MFSVKRGKNEVKMQKLAQKRERNLPKDGWECSIWNEKGKNQLEKAQ